jgi:hypothetical protein
VKITIRLQVFAVDLGHALELFDVLGHAGVFVVEVLAALELVGGGLGVLTLLGRLLVDLPEAMFIRKD